MAWKTFKSFITVSVQGNGFNQKSHIWMVANLQLPRFDMDAHKKVGEIDIFTGKTLQFVLNDN